MEEIVMKIAGYRYGKAPMTGYSINTATNKKEKGVSMASVENLPECKSFATQTAKEKRKKYYYYGDFAGFGSDDEIVMSNAKQMTKKEFLTLCTIEAKKFVSDLRIEGFKFCQRYELNYVKPMFDKEREKEILDEIKKRYAKNISEWSI